MFRAVVLVMLAASLFGQAAPRIQVAISPALQTAAPGEAIAFVIQVNAPSGWVVNLTADIPFQCVYSIKPPSLQSGQTAVLLLTPSAQVRAESYRIIVTAQYQSEKVEAAAQVQIVAPRKLTVQIEPKKLVVGINTTILLNVNPPVSCIATLQGLGLNYTFVLENGRGQFSVMPLRDGALILMVEAQGYLPYVEVIQVEGYQSIDFVQYVAGSAILIAVFVAILVVARIVMKRRGKVGVEGAQRRRPPPPPPSGPGSGVVCPTCGTLTDTRFCPRCGTRVRPH